MSAISSVGSSSTAHLQQIAQPPAPPAPAPASGQDSDGDNDHSGSVASAAQGGAQGGSGALNTIA
ncbi:MAG: hypothetical protein JSR21_21065 [Proteobacteria bacterium]|nr:hypothetical protein [Pseudomonadota bacterium]